ncbi:MAG: hypothetical protein ACTHVE_06300 [Senegalia sp. (in: firmicutes)]|uniref:hypothetical protein n=1 Tax=Senegalia sp. (in: firmicutes) TaxID=1924098 RepID=UPI003F9BCEC0
MNKNQTIKNMIDSSNEQNKGILKLSILDIIIREEEMKDNNKHINNILSKLEDESFKINNIKNEVFKNINNMNSDFLNTKKTDINYYKGIRNDIHNNLIDLSRYLTEISYYNNIYYDILSREKFKENIPVNFEEFYKKVYDFLMEDEKYINQKVSQIIWIIPMKMTKNKYYFMLKKSLQKSFENTNKEKAEDLFKRYKSIFNGTLEWEYVNSFSNYFIETQRYKEFNYKKSSYEDLDKVFMDSNKDIKDIERLLDLLRELGLTINKFIIISILFQDMNEKDKEDIKRFLNKVSKYDYNRILDENKLIEEKLVDVTKRYQEDTKEIIEKNIEIEGDLKDIYQKTEKVLVYLNDYYIEKEEILLNNDEIIKENYLDKLIENFIDFIDRNIKNMDNVNRKIRMKKILSLLEDPFNSSDEFFDYLKASIEFNNDKQEIKYIMNEIYNIINKN